MDRSKLRLASKLLAKAEDTAYEAEAAALAAKAYALLAEFLNAVDDGARNGDRRRERRLLHDRRAARRFFGKRSSGTAGAGTEKNSRQPENYQHGSTRRPGGSYAQGDRQPDRPTGGDIDLRA